MYETSLQVHTVGSGFIQAEDRETLTIQEMNVKTVPASIKRCCKCFLNDLIHKVKIVSNQFSHWIIN